MLENTAFTAHYKTDDEIHLKTPEGVMVDSCQANIGVLNGHSRTLKTIVCDGSEGDNWQILNLVRKDGSFYDHVAVKGAVSPDQGIRLCQKYIQGEYSVHSGHSVSDNALKVMLSTPIFPSYSPYLLTDDVNKFEQQATMTPVHWDDSNKLTSHNSMESLMLDMARADGDQALLEHMNPEDIVGMIVDEHCVFQMQDAMIMKYSFMQKAMTKLAEALKQADTEEFFVKSVTPIEPFKRLGVVNVGVIFEMSDSQTVTLLFHNPDTTPGKLLNTDIITSWKWLLNRRDVTAVLQPRSVDAKKYPLIAERIHKLLAQNHARFKRAQAGRHKDELLLNELVAQLEAGQLELKNVMAENESVQKQIDDFALQSQAAPEQSDVDPQNEESADSPAENTPADVAGAGSSLELAQGDFVSAKFAKANKQNNLGVYYSEVAEGQFHSVICLIQKVVHLSTEAYDEIAQNLLDDNPAYSGLGGTWASDEKGDDTYVNFGTAIIAPERETLIIDAQGYGYARYVGIQPQKTAAPASAPEFKINSKYEVQLAEDAESDAELTADTLPDGFTLTEASEGYWQLRREDVGRFVAIMGNPADGYQANSQGATTGVKATLSAVLEWGVNLLDEVFKEAQAQSEAEQDLIDNWREHIPADMDKELFLKAFESVKADTLRKGVNWNEAVIFNFVSRMLTTFKDADTDPGKFNSLSDYLNNGLNDMSRKLYLLYTDGNVSLIGKSQKAGKERMAEYAKELFSQNQLDEYEEKVRQHEIARVEAKKQELMEDIKRSVQSFWNEIPPSSQGQFIEMFNKGFDPVPVKKGVHTRYQFKNEQENREYKIINHPHYRAMERAAKAAAATYGSLRTALEELGLLKAKESENPEAVAQFTPEISRYSIKNPNPRARKPIGSIRITTREDGDYDVLFSKDGVGGEYTGNLPSVQGWITHRMASLGGAVAGISETFADIAVSLELLGGADVLGIQQPAAAVQPVTEPSAEVPPGTAEENQDNPEQNIDTGEDMPSEDQKFLNDVISGAVDLSSDATYSRLEQIGENLAPELSDLFEQAADAIAQFAVTNANGVAA